MRVELKCPFSDTCGEANCMLAEKIELRDDEINSSFLQSFISQKIVIFISKKNTINNYILSMYDVNEEN